MTITELSALVDTKTAGAFDTNDMAIMVPELHKLTKGDTYLEVGVDRGRSFAIAWYAVAEGVACYGVDVNDTPERQAMFAKEKMTTFIHQPSVEAAKAWDPARTIKLLFIDAAHDYANVKADLAAWRPFMAPGGVILFHDHVPGSGVMRAVSEWADSEVLQEYSFPVQIDGVLSRSSIAKVVLHA